MKKGWEYKKIDDISKIVGRIGFRGYTKNDLVSRPELGAITLSPSNIVNGELSFDKCSYISIMKYEESPEIMLAKGDVVLVKTASIGKCAIVRDLPHKATLNPQFVVFKEIVINNEFFAYYIKSPFFQKKLKTIVGGVAIPTLSQKKLGQLDIYYPSSLAEQRRIVSYLDSSFDYIDKIKENASKSLSEAKALFQSSLAEAMEPKEGWEEKKLYDISIYSIGLTYKPNDVSEKGTIVLRSTNIQDDKLNFDDIVRVNTKIKDSLYVKNGDILMCSRNGSPRLVGKVAKIENISEPMTFGTFMMIIRSDYNDYLYYFFKSDCFRNQIKHGEANMINQITRYMLDDVIINLPSISEQEQIVSHLDSLSSKVRAIEEKYQKMIAECDALKQAMLREVFE